MTIRQHPQHGKQLGSILDLVEHHQTAKRLEDKRRFVQLPDVARMFEIEPHDRTPPLPHELAGKGRLPDLARAE